ncbi:MAG: hypothetical protein MI975_14940 [Cytophagales bacterium]|nr:hypothetical protein [Cytophagales bacterium]
MKKIIIILIAVFSITGTIAAGDTWEKSNIPIAGIDPSDEKIEVIHNGSIHTENTGINQDINLMLSTNSRLQKRSSDYILDILKDQINWDYRTKIYLFKKQEGKLQARGNAKK